MRIVDVIKENAAKYADKTAIICKDKSVTYAQLWERIAARTAELQSEGLTECMPYPFRASQDIDFVVNYFAVHRANAVAVPLEASLNKAGENRIREKLSTQKFTSDIADVLFTTGTTGESKGVMISHRTIMADAENLADAQGFSFELLFIICGPLNHIGSLSKLYPTFLMGGTVCVLDGMKDLDAFYKVMDLPYEKFGTFLVPASIRMLLKFSADRLASCSGKIDFIETGAAPLFQSDMEQFCKALPNVRLYNTYASTETGIITTFNFNEGKCVEGCLGCPMKHSTLEILEDGIIVCGGDTLMSGYVGDQEATNKILRNGRIYTTDLGYLDEDGMLRLTGRASDVINVGGFKVAPFEVESAALTIPEIADCVCVPAKHPVLGLVVKLLVVWNSEREFDKKYIAKNLSVLLEAYKVPAQYEQIEKVNRTFNGKIDRKSYRV